MCAVHRFALAFVVCCVLDHQKIHGNGGNLVEIRVREQIERVQLEGLKATAK